MLVRLLRRPPPMDAAARTLAIALRTRPEDRARTAAAAHAGITLPGVGLEDSQKLARLAAAGTRLHIDGGTAEVLDSFDRAGVRAIMLKGPSIARWLYTDGTERPYNDCDLLVAPEQFDAAGQTLRALGYEPLLDRWGLPAWWYGHAVAWTHPDGRVGVDLHRTLLGVGVNPATAWRVLSADPDELVVAGRRVRCLGLPARAMHVALHATQHGPGTQPAVDLERAVTVCDDALWVGAARLAAQLDATAAFVAGLRLTPGWGADRHPAGAARCSLDHGRVAREHPSPARARVRGAGAGSDDAGARGDRVAQRQAPARAVNRVGSTGDHRLGEVSVGLHAAARMARSARPTRLRGLVSSGPVSTAQPALAGRRS